MTLHVIRPTSCPSSEELSRSWSLVVASRFPNGLGTATVGYLGRIVDDGELDGLITLADPFDYVDEIKLQGNPKAPQIGWERRIFPFCGLDVARVRVTAREILPLSELSPVQLDSLRERLIAAWDGRDELRKKGGRVTVASAGTLVQSLLEGGDGR